MVQTEQSNLIQSSTRHLRAQVATFASENRRALQVTGLIVVAGVAGAVGGIWVVKSMAAGKGAAANVALAAKGGAAVKASTTSLPAALASKGASTASAAAASPATTGTSIQGVTNAVNTTATTGAEMADKVTAIWNTLTANALPLTTGVVSGSAAGVGATRGPMNKVKEQLEEQAAQTSALQAQTSELKEVLEATETSLSQVQAKLEAPNSPSSSEPDNLEQIHGIGRVFAQRLNEAGIYTFADLAAQTPEALETIIGKTRAGAMFQPETWIEEARQFIDEQKKDVDLPAESIATSSLSDSANTEIV